MAVADPTPEVLASVDDAEPFFIEMDPAASDAGGLWTSAGVVGVSESGCVHLGEAGASAVMLGFPLATESDGAFADLGGLESVIGRRIHVWGAWLEDLEEISGLVRKSIGGEEELPCSDIRLSRLQLVEAVEFADG